MSAVTGSASTVRWRLRLVMVVLMTLPVLLLARAYQLQVVERDFLIGQAKARHQRTLPTIAHRGRILDRHGEPLAVSTPVWSIWTDPTRLKWTPSDRLALAEILGTSSTHLQGKITSSPSPQFAYLARRVAPEISEKVKNLDIGGIYLQREYRRYYPMAEMLSQVIGFTNVDDHGQEGMERLYDKALSARQGKTLVLRDRHGYAFDEIEEIIPARDGQDISLSIDKKLQYLTYQKLLDGKKIYRPKSLSAVMMDVQTGEILAMASWPSFNPNDMSQRRGPGARNRALTDTYEPGSTIKPFTALTAMMSGRYNSNSLVATAPGYMRIDTYRIRDTKNYGTLTLAGILKKSSNVGMSKVALSLPRESIWSTLNSFGFGHETGILFPGESRGSLRSPERWYAADHAAVSYGYGISTTLTQLVRGYSGLAAGGVLPEPSLLLKQNPEPGVPVAPEALADSVLHMLRAVTEEGGTGTRAAVPGYHVAGKTGTTIKQSVGNYDSKHYVSSFIGVAPATRPRVALGIIVDQASNGDFYGGAVAGPIFSAIMAETLRTLGVPPDNPKSLQIAQASPEQ